MLQLMATTLLCTAAGVDGFPAGTGHVPCNVEHVWVHSNTGADSNTGHDSILAALEDSRLGHRPVHHRCAQLPRTAHGLQCNAAVIMYNCLLCCECC
jgi:hypothetical protein